MKMLYEEFLAGTKKEHNIQMQYAYEIINEMYTKNELDTKEDCYLYFKKNEKKVLLAALVKVNSAFIEARKFIERQIYEISEKLEWVKYENSVIVQKAKYFYERQDGKSAREKLKRIQAEMSKVDELEKTAEQLNQRKEMLQKSLEGFASIGFYR